MIIHNRFFPFLLFFSWWLHSQIHEGSKILSAKLSEIRSTLHTSLTDSLITSITNELAQAKAKIILLQNQLALSPEKTNPFLQGFIDELKNEIATLDALFTIKKLEKNRSKESLALPIITPLPEQTMRLLKSWYDYEASTFTHFNTSLHETKISPATYTQEKKQEQQKKLNDWRSEAFNIVHDTLKTVQNTLFDLTLGYNSTYLTTFNEIISTINTMPELPPPLVPTRSSSFITEQAPTPPLTWENRLKKKVVEAKDYAAKSLSPIAERLKKITISEEGTQEKISKKDTSYESIESTHPSQYHIAPKNPSKKIKKIVHDIYNSTKQSAALMSITTESQSLLACAQFVKIPNLFTKSNPFVLDSLQKTAKLIGHMLVTNAQQSVNLRENFFSIKKNLYDAIVLLPNLLYTTILTKRIAWIGHETNQYYTQSSTMLHHLLQPTPLHSTSLSTQEQHEAILYMHTFLKQQKLTNVESILSGYILLRSIGIITSPYKKNLAATQDLISQATLNIVTETKEAILVFLKNSLYTGLQSPFPVTQDLFTHIFIQLNRLYKLEPLILLLKETRTDELALGVKKHYEQIDLAIHAINNAFAICKTAAKKRAENEQFLTTASLLHETLEHSLTLIKSFMPNLP